MRLTAVGIILFLLSASFVCAQENTTTQWNPPSAGPITTWTAPVVGKGKLAVQPFFVYTHTRGNFNDEGHYDALPEGEKKSQFIQQIFAQYGITDKWEIDAQMAYQENFATASEVKGHDQGFADSLLFTRYTLIEETNWMPQLTGLLQLKMPTGRYQHLDSDKNETDLMGTGSWDPGVGINLTKKLAPFIVHSDLIASFPQTVRVDGEKTQYAAYLNYDVAVEYFLPKGFNVMLELNASSQGDKKVGGDKIPASDAASLSFSPGIGWSNDCLQVLIAYQRTLLGTNVPANDSVVTTFVYTF